MQHKLISQELAVGGGFGFVLCLQRFHFLEGVIILLLNRPEHGFKFFFPLAHSPITSPNGRCFPDIDPWVPVPQWDNPER